MCKIGREKQKPGIKVMSLTAVKTENGPIT